jgi:hypothetical protein
MSEDMAPQSGTKNLRGVTRAMLTTLPRYWTDAEGYQKFAYAIGALLIFSAVFHTGVLVVTRGSLEGDVSWRKPILFGEAFGLTVLSVSWFMSFLPRKRVAGWLLLGVLGVANFEEVLWVSLQQWRGVPSHFNFNTPFDAALFNTNGVMIGFAAIVITIVAIWSFFSLRAPASLAWAIRAGMALLVVAQIIGILMLQNGIPKVIDFETGEFISEGTRSAHIFGEAGDMKVPHALTLHAAQVLPVLAWLLLFTNWSETRRMRTVIVAAAGYTGLVIVSVFQTFSGLAPFDLSFLAALVFGISAFGLIVAYTAALIGLHRTVAH